MKRILITTLLACLSTPPAAFSGIGDTYYCDIVEDAGYKKGKIERYKPGRFTFCWNKGEIVFGKGSTFFDGTSVISNEFSNIDQFDAATGQWDRITFVDGRFRYVSLLNGTKEQADELGFPEASIIIANCSKFDD